jgi:uncharacterized protein DUF4055
MLHSTLDEDPLTKGLFSLADPTAAAYARIQTGTSRSHRPYQVLAPGLEDLVPNPSYVERFDAWATIRDCYDGEKVIKEAGEQYLPKLSAHKADEYLTYKKRAYFYNAIRRTHRGLHGSLFRKPVELTAPDEFLNKINLSDITQDGQSFQAFCRIVGHELLLTGRFGVLTDFKAGNDTSPYLAGYLAENIYSWRTKTVEDREIVDRVVLLESEVVPTEWGFTSSLLIRILRLDPQTNGSLTPKMVYSQTLLRPNATSPDVGPAREDIAIKMKGRQLDYIPFVFFNAMDLRSECGPPPLEDIASINISHYQSTAHLEHGRFYAGMPTYVTAGSGANKMPGLPEGLTTTQPLTVGPSFVWELEENAKAWLLEFTGHGLTFLENAVDSKQLQMQSLGGRLISSTRRAAAMSDEAWQLLETGDEATLMDVAQVCDEGVTQALAYLGDILGVVDKPHEPKEHKIIVEFNKEFVRSELTARELRALQALAERGHIPNDVMYYALREVGVIPIEYSLDDFTKLMAKKDQKWEAPPPPPFAPGQPGATTPGGTGPGGTPGVRPQVPPRPVLKPNPPPE